MNIQRFFTKIIAVFISFCLLSEQAGLAQAYAGQINLSALIGASEDSFVSDKFRPLHLRYLAYDPASNDLKLLLDKGDAGARDINIASRELLDYFLIGITLPNDCFWVNLRPDSPEAVIDPYLAQTDVGKILLEADVQLKKDTALSTSPSTPEGRMYWEKMYAKARELYGETLPEIPAVARPWIVPAEIVIRESAIGVDLNGAKSSVPNAYLHKATLKVMLEQDYLRKDVSETRVLDERQKKLNEYSAKLMRELVIPGLNKAVNSSRRYSSLRKVFYSLIMAQWFKSRLSGKGGLYGAMIDRKDLQGLTSKEAWSTEYYFNEYRESFQKGEYNLKEQVYTFSGQAARFYVSGGILPVVKDPFPAGEQNAVVTGNVGVSQVSCINAGDDTAVLTDTNIPVVVQGESGEIKPINFPAASHDYGVTDGNNGVKTAKEHEGFHYKGRFGAVLADIAGEINASLRQDGRYDIRGAVSASGGKIMTSHGQLRIENDGVLVVIDSRFKRDHAGRDEFCVYARNESKARHELTELRDWLDFTEGIYPGINARDGNMGKLLRDWSNGRGSDGEQLAGEDEIAARRSVIEEKTAEFHRLGLIAEWEYNLKNARFDEGETVWDVLSSSLSRHGLAIDALVRDYRKENDIFVVSEDVASALISEGFIVPEMDAFNNFGLVLVRGDRLQGASRDKVMRDIIHEHKHSSYNDIHGYISPEMLADKARAREFLERLLIDEMNSYFGEYIESEASNIVDALLRDGWDSDSGGFGDYAKTIAERLEKHYVPLFLSGLRADRELFESIRGKFIAAVEVFIDKVGEDPFWSLEYLKNSGSFDEILVMAEKEDLKEKFGLEVLEYEALAARHNDLAEEHWQDQVSDFENAELGIGEDDGEKDFIIASDAGSTGVMRSALRNGERDKDVLLRKIKDYSGVLTKLGNKDGVHGGSVDGTGHDKYLDANGDIWLFKSYPSRRVHRALVDEFVYKIGKLLGFEESLAAFMGRVNGQTGVFVKWVDNSGLLWDELKKYGRDMPKHLPKSVLKRIVREQVLDWLVSQHDSHAGSFLKIKNGSMVYPIDKSQAFKYMGETGSKKERLSVDYNPNGDINGSQNIHYWPIYNLVLPSIAKGETALSLEEAWQEVENVIKRVQAIPTDEYIDHLNDYAVFRFDVVRSPEELLKNSKDFLSLARHRKDSIADDFKKLYETLGLNVLGKEALNVAAETAIKEKLKGRDVKVLLMDLDGTLADQSVSVSSRTSDLLSAAHDSGMSLVVISEDYPGNITRRMAKVKKPVMMIGYGGAENISESQKGLVGGALNEALGGKIESLSAYGYQLRLRLKPGVDRRTAASEAQKCLDKKGLHAYVFFASSSSSDLKIFLRHKVEAAVEALEKLGIDPENAVVLLDSAQHQFTADWYLAKVLSEKGALVVNVGKKTTDFSDSDPNLLQLPDAGVGGSEDVLKCVIEGKKSPGKGPSGSLPGVGLLNKLLKNKPGAGPGATSRLDMTDDKLARALDLVEKGSLEQAVQELSEIEDEYRQIIDIGKDASEGSLSRISAAAAEERLSGVLQLKKELLSTGSQAVSGNAPVPATVNDRSDKGGVDFRDLPSVTGGNSSARVFLKKSDINIEEYDRDIKRMLSEGIIPSYQRMVDFFSACYAEGSSGSIERALIYCSEVLRLQEDDCAGSKPELIEFLSAAR